jgi:phosphatidylinositol alpha-mannosyltransferase
MRVGLVCPYSLDVHGGVQNHVLGLASSLHGLGHEVAVLAPGEDADDLPAYVTTTGRAVPVPFNGAVGRVSFGPFVAARVRRWIGDGDFDVLHVHEPAAPSLSVLALWAARCPVVATFHMAQSRSRTLETSAATVLRSALSRIDAHIAVSVEAEETMARYVAARPRVIPNGLDVDLYSGVPVTRPADPTLVFLGRVDETRKGFGLLLEAFPSVLRSEPAARLVVVGSGRRPSLRALGTHAASRVEMLGPLEGAAKSSVLAGADALVAPNTHGESFGLVLLEAMAAGTAVVASDLPAFRRVLGDGSHGVLFRAGDPHDLGDAVVRILRDETGRRRLVAEATRAVADYDWSRVAPQVEKVYADVTNGAVGQRAG